MRLSKWILALNAIFFTGVLSAEIAGVKYCGQMVEFTATTAVFKAGGEKITVARVGPAPKGSLPSHQCVVVDQKTKPAVTRSLASAQAKDEQRVQDFEKRDPARVKALRETLARLIKKN